MTDTIHYIGKFTKYETIALECLKACIQSEGTNARSKDNAFQALEHTEAFIEELEKRKGNR